ncbi:hypothetical protein LSH36_951g00007 [Paralvinella palmiformis]|uniref:Uncharacterized protein n=1 Tax=Paralvinella palmiformis TaxID=53620 RepID=A0AAD9IXE2_9ANNE|nr:hypothetical protein LSH36_951g00007 [Paralvinella palmiformis]
MFPVPDSIQGYAKCSSVGPDYRTDHSLISINCCFVDLERGPGYWKLNCLLLIDPEYVNLMRAVIKEYCDQHKTDGLTPDLDWEMLKMEFRRTAIAYSASKKREQQKEQNI